MIREFSSKGHDPKAESHYQDWIEQHRTNGFVFNLFGGTSAEYNIVHRCSCGRFIEIKMKVQGSLFPSSALPNSTNLRTQLRISWEPMHFGDTAKSVSRMSTPTATMSKVKQSEAPSEARDVES